MQTLRPKDVDPELLRAHLSATRETGDRPETPGRYETLWNQVDDEHGATHHAHEVWNGHLVHSTFKQTSAGVETLNVVIHPLRKVEQVTLKVDEGSAVVVVGGRARHVPLTIGQRILAAG